MVIDVKFVLTAFHVKRRAYSLLERYRKHVGSRVRIRLYKVCCYLPGMLCFGSPRINSGRIMLTYCNRHAQTATCDSVGWRSTSAQRGNI
jgi:hypothetical protein